MRGIQPDYIDEALDSMVKRTMAGEVIGFDEWQDLVDDIAEEAEPDLTSVLQEHGLTMQELYSRAIKFAEAAEIFQKDML